MLYEFRCRNCGSTMHRTSRDPAPRCELCQSDEHVRRVWGFRMTSVMHEHRHNATGTVVSDRRHIRNDLAQMSEEQSERTGIAHNYVEVDMNDTAGLRVTDEGLDTTFDRTRAEGKEPTWRM